MQSSIEKKHIIFYLNQSIIVQLTNPLMKPLHGEAKLNLVKIDYGVLQNTHFKIYCQKYSQLDYQVQQVEAQRLLFSSKLNHQT